MKRKFVVSECEVKKVLMGEDFSVKMAEHSFAKERFLSFQKNIHHNGNKKHCRMRSENSKIGRGSEQKACLSVTIMFILSSAC